MSGLPDDSHMNMTPDACFEEFVDARTLSLIPPSRSVLPAQNDGSFNPDLVDPALTPMTDVDGAPQYPPLSHSGITSVQLSTTTTTPVGQPAAQSQPQTTVQAVVAAPQGQSEAIPRNSTRAITGNGSPAQSHTTNQPPAATPNQGISDSSQPTSAAQSTTGASSSQTASQTAPPAGNAEGNGGGEHAAEQDEKDMIRWTPETRYELLLQVAYERRHESMSEAAWHRIARGSRGGPWMEASWNGVRLEFSRLMSERFRDYGRSPGARERRDRMQAIANAQENGAPSTVTEAELNPAVSDATTEPAPPRRRPRARARTTTTASVQKSSIRGGRGRGRGRGRGGCLPTPDVEAGNDGTPNSEVS